ncbi:energy transducer TonB [Xylanibacter muris]|uniref:Energy transducer TonB n=1 Tax=Xylanibacter muris TaxID=2736290 RepID=A0ABX2AMS7_9BACT|nr:energy transducer TonB [Xylanibacter muris]NPD92493.1 energy transducer TonB [Xylanibacter muris]
MKRILLLLAFMPMFVFAQNATEAQKKNALGTDVQSPMFPGGADAMREYFSKNTKYPEEARSNGVQGRVIIDFIVGVDGSVKDINVVRHIAPALDEEAVRVVKAMPKWIPAKKDGKHVEVKMTLPVVFRLPEKSGTTAEKKPKIFSNPEKLASFPGGKEALMNYLAENVKYPAAAEKQGIKGRVVVSFAIGVDGSVTEAKVLKSVNPLLDEEAVRVVEAMPKWIPAKLNGKPVEVKYSVPITFDFAK